MQELGELDSRFADFAQRGLRIVVVSVENQEETAQLQGRFPHLTMLADPGKAVTEAFQALHKGAGPGGSDIAAPRTYLLDADGTVRWRYQPDRVIVRLTPGELLAAADQQLATK